MQALALSEEFLRGWLLIPLLIFIARTLDVSIGTIRIILLSRGHSLLAPALGFLEILIWLLAIGQVFANLNNWACYIAYAGGFALGNWAGMQIEERLAMGTQLLRVVTRRSARILIRELRDHGFGVTVVDGRGATGPVSVIFALVKRKDLSRAVATVQARHPSAFYSVEDVRFVADGVFPTGPAHRAPWLFWRRTRKGK